MLSYLLDLPDHPLSIVASIIGTLFVKTSDGGKIMGALGQSDLAKVIDSVAKVLDGEMKDAATAKATKDAGAPGFAALGELHEHLGQLEVVVQQPAGAFELGQDLARSVRPARPGSVRRISAQKPAHESGSQIPAHNQRAQHDRADRSEAKQDSDRSAAAEEHGEIAHADHVVADGVGRDIGFADGAQDHTGARLLEEPGDGGDGGQ